MQITNNKTAFIAGSKDDKDYIIRSQKQELVALRDEVSGLKTRLYLSKKGLESTRNVLAELDEIITIVQG